MHALLIRFKMYYEVDYRMERTRKIGAIAEYSPQQYTAARLESSLLMDLRARVVFQ